jgi:hypothetical protein
MKSRTQLQSINQTNIILRMWYPGILCWCLNLIGQNNRWLFMVMWAVSWVKYSVHKLDFRGSVHHSIIHKEIPTRCSSISKFYFIFMWSSTCFGRHTAHHQEPKTALGASGFAYVVGCWTCSCWTLTASSNYTSNNPPRMQNQRLLVQF